MIMKNKFSRQWVRSKQPRKQRKYRYNAPLHIRQKLVSIHLDKALRKDYKRRSMPARKGDEVAVMRGDFNGRKGTISRIDLSGLKVYIENMKTKKASGQEVEAPFEPSNLKITSLNLDDKKRIKAIRRKEKVIK
jgi:large subunit ribosomal protein L24